MDKRQLSERDICTKFITPALRRAGWDEMLQIREEVTLLVPLPPLAEQHRIVAKVDELMALCDRLEASLTTGDETRRRLLDALLAEALAPEEALDREAAE
jgi:type I restriction enzyme S subunit